MEVQQLINELQHGAPPRKLAKKRSLKGGAIGLENTCRPNVPPKKKKAKKPLKKELSNPQGLDFANEAGTLMAQPLKVEMLPPKDMKKEATRPEKQHLE